MNIPNEELQPGAGLCLVLLVRVERLFDAPRVSTVEAATGGPAQGSVRQYWNR